MNNQSEKNQSEKNQSEKNQINYMCKHITCHARQEARRIGGRYYDKILERFVCMGGCEKTEQESLSPRS